MDFQFTSRPSTNMKPVWATSSDDPKTPKKRSHDALAPATSPFPGAQPPTFGTNQGSPFLFNTPAPQTPHAHPWAPPPLFSPEKAFPQPQFQELKDIDMSEASPPKPEEGDRTVATGALRRVFKSRERAREKNKSRLALTMSADDDGSGSDSDEEERGRVARKTSNHYTLNLPSAPAPQSDTPYILLGYLQFFFNLSLVLVFLYLVLQFILTVQRDVEQRISEYSMDIVQEIAMCATQFRNNLCAPNPIPAMAHQCASWETCMNRDPTIVGRAKVGAEMIAEVVNGFVEPISWKTLAFTLTSLSFLTVFINTLLSLYRSRHHPAPPPMLHQPSYPIPPSTPFPREHFGGYLSPAPTPGWVRPPWAGAGGDDQLLETPSRRRRLDGGAAAKVK
ncbi:hypothetical protein FIBSPDRAFT_726197 [Athelia psychrophila]|uniref:Brl1/Brr6 domain-containing protein n=1 Tax=Athelia psychrophila TaxID=1759441 RepID=A0A166TB83_9AGAM|nr:hypothetical protein FIBSPDRAFT_750633 [Fibularhizoctonia sp. CBS 109695]KZP30428.1 hypothetical protein FIBSPDRAFT_726197 [Fibularhizoctonia sp. CBS 109695]